MLFKKAGTVTGLYREDYGYIPTAACFAVYRDVWREVVGKLTTLSGMSDDSYEARIVTKKKDKD